MANDPLTVPIHEHGLVRLFATELEPEGDAAITRNNVAKLLGGDVVLNPTKVEVTTTRAIEALGLTTYLSQGYGIAEADLMGKSAALDALKGLIILIPSSAFETRPQTLDPNPALRFIGTFREEAAAAPGPMARAETEGTELHPPEMPAPQATRRGSSWTIALGALIIAAALILWMAL